MKDFALYMNGNYRDVLDEALAVQQELPEQVLYLQPYKSERIVELTEGPPSLDDPVLLLASTTDDLNTVQYAAEVIHWRDKRELTSEQQELLDQLIKVLQPKETGLYDQVRGTECVNLISVRNLRRISKPFSVTELVNANRGGKLKERTRAGGWVYVRLDSVPPGVI